MAPVDVVDLTLDESDVEEASPSRGVLSGFQPRKEKRVPKGNALRGVPNGRPANGPRTSAFGESYDTSTCKTNTDTSTLVRTTKDRQRDSHGVPSELAIIAQDPRERTLKRKRPGSIHTLESFGLVKSHSRSSSQKASSVPHEQHSDRPAGCREQSHHKLDRPHASLSRILPAVLDPRRYTHEATQEGPESRPSVLNRRLSQARNGVTQSRLHSHGRSSPRAIRPVVVDGIDPDVERICSSAEPVFRPNKDPGPWAPTEEPQRQSQTRTQTEAQIHIQPQAQAQTRPPAHVQVRLQPHIQTQSKVLSESAFNRVYSTEEKQLVKKLKEEDGLSFEAMVPFFSGRTAGSLSFHYYTKLRNAVRPKKKPDKRDAPIAQETSSSFPGSGRNRRVRTSNVATMDGFVSWASLKTSGIGETGDPAMAIDDVEPAPNPEPGGHLTRQDRVYPSSTLRVLRNRELGVTGRRAWSAFRNHTTEELKNHVFEFYSLQRQYHGTSGDVVALSWSPDSQDEKTRFAVGSIAISDNASMQYNMSRNLLIGDGQGELLELPDHHVQRPLITDADNINGLHAMRESQDPRLFLTVTATGFSRGNDMMFSAGSDKKIRAYTTARKSLNDVKCLYSIEHAAPVELMSVHEGSNSLASGCHASSDSVHVHVFAEDRFQSAWRFSPTRREAAMFPSSLKWGSVPVHQQYLLGGFSGDAEKDNTGETCLWDANAGKLVASYTTYNVFDVAWNLNPSPASIAFVVACNPYGVPVSKGMRSVIQCFAPDQVGTKRTLTWQCPAADINDVMICPHDSNLIAAGATNGTVYVWDQRSADRSQQPLHTLRHGETENVVDHDRDPETTDTGVRFLSWGLTKSRLFSGSSDGVVKVWNPYRSSGNTHVDDIAPPSHQRSAIMSGAFSADYQELLLGTENGRIDLWNTRNSGATGKVRGFKLHTAATPSHEDSDPYEPSRELLRNGQIELRPCGSMPFRQAVQGPNYCGPFVEPSMNEIVKAGSEYQAALHAQNKASMSMESAGSHPDSPDEDLAKASCRVRAAQQQLSDLRERQEHALMVTPRAEEFQRSLREAEIARQALLPRTGDTKPCKLDCGVLPTADEIEDSDRSKLRIPAVLRSIPVNAALSQDAMSSGSARCPECQPWRPDPRRQAKSDEDSCPQHRLEKSGLITLCSKCSGPARREKSVCEKCRFACFRCGEPAIASPSMTLVTCAPCGLSWEANVLGYELQNKLFYRPRQRTERAQNDEDGLGGQEREHYASLWQIIHDEETL